MIEGETNAKNYPKKTVFFAIPEWTIDSFIFFIALSTVGFSIVLDLNSIWLDDRIESHHSGRHSILFINLFPFPLRPQPESQQKKTRRRRITISTIEKKLIKSIDQPANIIKPISNANSRYSFSINFDKFPRLNRESKYKLLRYNTNGKNASNCFEFSNQI